MKVMILAAGKGTRMRPLTDCCPKPLLEAAGKPLLQHWLDKLAAVHTRQPITEVVINAAYLHEQIEDFILDFKAPFPVRVSVEYEPLETAGGIQQALPLLGEEPFILINGDVFCDFEVESWLQTQPLKPRGLAHLLMVENPVHNTSGDFVLSEEGLITQNLGAGEVVGFGKTFAGLSVISPELIKGYPHRRECFALREVFDWAIAQQAVSGESFAGFWLDVGTPERLQALDKYLIHI